jgi:hypothetical protein
MRKRNLLAAVAGVTAVVGAAAGAGWLAWRLMRTGRREAWRAWPVLTELLQQHAGRIDFADAWMAFIDDGESDDPARWAVAITKFPSAIVRLIRLRDALVRPFGLATMTDHGLPPTGFPVIATGDHELVAGADDEHLNFRLGVTTGEGVVAFTTTVTINNRLGRLYWAVVRWFHPIVVGAMLRRAEVN